jgi:hypothetical protein
MYDTPLDGTRTFSCLIKWCKSLMQQFIHMRDEKTMEVVDFINTTNFNDSHSHSIEDTIIGFTYCCTSTVIILVYIPCLIILHSLKTHLCYRVSCEFISFTLLLLLDTNLHGNCRLYGSDSTIDIRDCLHM